MLVKRDPKTFLSFLSDSSSMSGGHAERLYIPETYEDVVKVLKKCSHEKTPLTISGNGTGTTGARIPFGGFLLSMHLLDKIIDDLSEDLEDGQVTVQAGLILQTLNDVLKPTGFFYPPDPTERQCFIGATIANNSSGAESYKYGPTRNYISRLKIALPLGEILDCKRGEYLSDSEDTWMFSLPSGKEIRLKAPSYLHPKTKKNVAGYYSSPSRPMDLIDLFIGSEGTLGVIVEADLKLLPRLKGMLYLLIYFRSQREALLFSKHVVESQDLDVSAIEFFDNRSLSYMKGFYSDIPKHTDAAIMMHILYRDDDKDQTLIKWDQCLDRYGVIDTLVATSSREKENMRQFRHALPLAMSDWYARHGVEKLSTDMSVPSEHFEELFSFYKSTCREERLDHVLFGHIGDYHLHLNILPRNKYEIQKAKNLYSLLVDKVMALGGTLSAEHGVGKLKAKYLQRMFSNQDIQDMVSIKKTLDPSLILNRGNIFSESTLWL